VVEADLSPVARSCFPSVWPTRGGRPGLRRADRGLRCASRAHVIWERALARQTPAGAATIIEGSPTLLGGRLLLDADGESSSLRDARLRQQLSTATQDAICAGISRRVTLTSSDGEARIEVIAPPTTLIIVGVVHIATVLAKLPRDRHRPAQRLCQPGARSARRPDHSRASERRAKRVHSPIGATRFLDAPLLGRRRRR